MARISSDREKYPGSLWPVSELPHPPKRIRKAFVDAIKLTNDPDGQLQAALAFLDYFVSEEEVQERNDMVMQVPDPSSDGRATE